MSTASLERSQVRSYMYFRVFIGILGMAFPFVLVIGRMLFEGWGILDSISDYYYSVSMRNVLVAGLVALAILLISYHYARTDDLASTAAGICAIGVALFPVAPAIGATPRQTFVGLLHYGCAAALFLILAYFALFLFTKPAAPIAQALAHLSRTLLRRPATPVVAPSTVQLTHRKRQRNGVYVVRGSIIVACILLLLLLRLPGMPHLQSLHPVFWLETLAICAFGVGWIVKGEVILADQRVRADLFQHSLSQLKQAIVRIRAYLTNEGKRDPRVHEAGSMSRSRRQDEGN